MFNESLPRSRDNHPDDRLKDRTGKCPTDTEQIDGILNRVSAAQTGEVLKLRDNTEQLVHGCYQRHTFSDVKHALHLLGIADWDLEVIDGKPLYSLVKLKNHKYDGQSLPEVVKEEIQYEDFVLSRVDAAIESGGFEDPILSIARSQSSFISEVVMGTVNRYKTSKKGLVVDRVAWDIQHWLESLDYGLHLSRLYRAFRFLGGTGKYTKLATWIAERAVNDIFNCELRKRSSIPAP